MGLHIVGNANDHGGDDDGPEHGRDTAIFQELLPVMESYRKWLARNKSDLCNDEQEAMAAKITDLFDELHDSLNVPF